MRSKNLVPFILLILTTVKLNALPVTNVSIRDTIPTDDSGVQIFNKVEKEADFLGGVEGWRTYLVQNLNPNTPVDKGAPAGQYTVWVQFIVDKEGKISDIKALTVMDMVWKLK